MRACVLAHMHARACVSSNVFGGIRSLERLVSIRNFNWGEIQSHTKSHSGSHSQSTTLHSTSTNLLLYFPLHLLNLLKSDRCTSSLSLHLPSSSTCISSRPLLYHAPPCLSPELSNVSLLNLLPFSPPPPVFYPAQPTFSPELLPISLLHLLLSPACTSSYSTPPV